MIDSWVAAVVGGYLLGSIPVAVLAGRARGFDPRQVGDQNPGFWNMKDQLGWAGAVPVLAGDTLKGTAAGLLGLLLAHGILGHGPPGGGAPGDTALVYAAVAAAMIGHAWPVFARLRGGRSVLTFAGGFAVICPPAFGLGIALCAGVALLTRSFAVGARTGVFAVPFLQLIFTPALEVAATGALMSLIGARFAMAALAARHRKGRRRPAAPIPARPPDAPVIQPDDRPGRPPGQPAGPPTPDSGGPTRNAPAGPSRPSSG
jgi:acyl phosphate:glycerol-3-phosphate acyltransferase